MQPPAGAPPSELGVDVLGDELAVDAPRAKALAPGERLGGHGVGRRGGGDHLVDPRHAASRSTAVARRSGHRVPAVPLEHVAAARLRPSASRRPCVGEQPVEPVPVGLVRVEQEPAAARLAVVAQDVGARARPAPACPRARPP